MKRDLREVEEEKWIEKANNRDQSKEITKVAIQRSDNQTSLTPTKGEEEQDVHTLDEALELLSADQLRLELDLEREQYRK